eukprot:CAMPEP_0114492668 /NCGR_PEP_ID=MMETSP0109-20121206/3683_1 /TAXON_ID=29199 /ORGANISM="Chlorarachnion reptans, Strain CCCM449" /LENGTH=180 /DNA_ID=CAMNT_0001669537 /DNA_START=1507 /DNA_END=2045 /DNA_ORIENTATION=+
MNSMIPTTASPMIFPGTISPTNSTTSPSTSLIKPCTPLGYSVVLQSAGPSELAAIVVIHEQAGIALANVTKMVENTPRPIKSFPSEAEGEALKNALELVGANATIVPQMPPGCQPSKQSGNKGNGENTDFTKSPGFISLLVLVPALLAVCCYYYLCYMRKKETADHIARMRRGGNDNKTS